MSLQPLRGSLARWTPKAGAAIDPLHAIAAAWPAIVGADVAANSAPVALNGETLTIATRSSAWSQQLQLLSLTIVRGIREQAVGLSVARLTFRAGAFCGERRIASLPAAAARARRRSDPARYEPAADLEDAFERVRCRVRAARRNAGAHCLDCGAPLAAGADVAACTPCAIASANERTIALERLIYAAPWLPFEAVREALPTLSVAEYERARRRLLARWWLRLERTRTAARPGNACAERAIASSYVLLQSRLAPDRVTAAVVRNVLGAELETLLFGERTAD